MARPRQNVVNNEVMRTKELIDLSPEILISRLREYITKYKLRQIRENTVRMLL